MWICSAKLKKIQNEIERNLEIKLLNRIKQEQEIDVHVKSMPDKGVSSIWEWIERCLKILAIFSPVGLLIGGFVIYSYLSKLEAISLFANIIGSPAILLSVILVTFISLGMILSVPFYAPYFIAKLLSQCNHSDKKSYFGSVIVPIIGSGFFIYGFYWFEHCKYKNFIFNIIAIILFICIPLIWVKLVFGIKIKIKDLELDQVDWYLNGWILYSFFTISNFLLFLFQLIIIDNTENPYGWLISFGFIYIINATIPTVFLQSKDSNSAVNLDNIWYIPTILVLIVITIQTINLEFQVTSAVLNKLGYIEKPKQKSWYLIDKRFFDWYVQDGGNINRLRLEFVPKNKWVDVIPSAMLKPYYEYENSVYGYLAWNLGDTKIICPENVDITKPIDVSNDIHKCLMIKADYLQPLPKIK